VGWLVKSIHHGNDLWAVSG